MEAFSQSWCEPRIICICKTNPCTSRSHQMKAPCLADGLRRSYNVTLEQLMTWIRAQAGNRANQSGHSLQRLETLPEYHVASPDMSKLRDFAFLRFSSCSSLSCFGLVTGIPTNKWNTLVVQSPCTLRGNALVKTTSSCRRILARRLRLKRPLTEDS